jgi:restriction system protein
MEKKMAPSKALGMKTVFASLRILEKHNNEMSIKDLLKEMEETIEFNDWEKARYDKSGYIRWQSVFHFYSIDCIKAGFLIKKSGVWYLTPEGVAAIKVGEEKLFEKITEEYKNWAKENASKLDQPQDEEDVEEEIESSEDILIYNDLLEKSLDGMIKFINNKNPYEFQDLVAALLRGMGYYTPFVAPKGKDGGVDIIAYKDPLGTTVPRIQIQIKHRENTAPVKEIRELMGLLQKDGDVGIFVSTGGFSPDAKATARISNVHIELIDQNRFIELWQSFYDKLSDQDRNLFPLKPIYFLDVN